MFLTLLKFSQGFQGSSVVKNPPANAGDLGSIPEPGRSPGEGNGWHPTPVFLSGKSHGRRGLVDCSPWDHKEVDTTEQLNIHTHTHLIFFRNTLSLKLHYLYDKLKARKYDEMFSKCCLYNRIQASQRLSPPAYLFIFISPTFSDKALPYSKMVCLLITKYVFCFYTFIYSLPGRTHSLLIFYSDTQTLSWYS